VILSQKNVNQKTHKSIFPCALPDSTGISYWLIKINRDQVLVIVSSVAHIFDEVFFCLVFLMVGAQACAIVFSTVDRDSFEAVEKWRSKVCWVYNSFINNIFNFDYLVRIRWGDQAILMTCYHTFFAIRVRRRQLQ